MQRSLHTPAPEASNSPRSGAAKALCTRAEAASMLHICRASATAEQPPMLLQGIASQWAAEFEQPQSDGARFALANPPPNDPTEDGWVQEFAEGISVGETRRKLTPAELKELRGPQPDDPLTDPDAPTWNAQFNASLQERSVNATDGELGTTAHQTPMPWHSDFVRCCGVQQLQLLYCSA